MRNNTPNRNEMESTPIKAYLSQGYYIPIAILAKAEQINTLKADSIDNSAVDSIIVELEKDIETLKTKYDEVKNRVQSMNFDNSVRQILELRYFNGLPMKEVAERLNYSVRWIERLRDKALIALEHSLDKDGVIYK